MGDETEEGVFIFATQGSINFIGNIVRKFVGFLFIAIATRLVPPSEYGVFVLGISIVMVAQGFASLNISRSIDYFIPKYLRDSRYGQAKKTLQNAFIIGTFSSLAGAILIIILREQIAMLFEEPRLAYALLFLVLLIPLQTINRMLLTSFNAIKKMQYRVVVEIVNPAIRTISAVIFVIGGAGISGLIGGYVLGIAFGILCGILFLFYEADWIQVTATEPISNRSLLSYSIPLVLAGIIYSLVGQIDFFIIGHFKSSAEVGQYQVAYILATNLLIVLSAVTPVFKPMIAEIGTDNALLQGRFQLATRWIAILTLPLTITLVLAPGIYLTILFTGEYAVAGSALVTLAIGYLLNAASGPEGMVLEGLGYTRLTLLNSIILVGINGVLDIILVPRIGILGAGIATGTALAIAGIIGIAEIYFLKNIHPYSIKLLRVYVATAFPIVAGILTLYSFQSQNVIALVLPLVVAISYVFGLQLTRGFTEDDAELAASIDEQIGYSIFSKIIRA